MCENAIDNENISKPAPDVSRAKTGSCNAQNPIGLAFWRTQHSPRDTVVCGFFATHPTEYSSRGVQWAEIALLEDEGTNQVKGACSSLSTRSRLHGVPTRKVGDFLLDTPTIEACG